MKLFEFTGFAGWKRRKKQSVQCVPEHGGAIIEVFSLAGLFFVSRAP
jgi:hypothetical protein